jgi:16S rRNA (uracil1498-N3)-methyltransferase
MVADRSGAPLTAPVAGTGEVLVVVGPEGGLTGTELELLAPTSRLGLGPHILRAETAAVATAAVFAVFRRQNAFDDRGERP